MDCASGMGPSARSGECQIDRAFRAHGPERGEFYAIQPPS